MEIDAVSEPVQKSTRRRAFRFKPFRSNQSLNRTNRKKWTVYIWCIITAVISNDLLSIAIHHWGQITIQSTMLKARRTFKVKQLIGKNKWTKTAITIHDDHIMGSKNPIVKIQNLQQIMVMKAHKNKDRKSTFTLIRGNDDTKSFPVDFVAKCEDQRNQIMFRIFRNLLSNLSQK